jgi:hypothetical protein
METSPLTLSMAIRLGSLLRPQGQGGWDDGKTACALMAVSLACGIPTRVDEYIHQHYQNHLDYAALWHRFPVLETRVIDPVSRVTRDLSTAIWFLNDKHGWTREQIADFVECIERAQQADAVKELETV